MSTTEVITSTPLTAATPVIGSRQRTVRMLGLVAAILGALLVLMTFVANGFGRAAAGSRLVEEARPAVGPAGIVKLRNDADLVINVVDAAVKQALPNLASQLRLSPEEFNAQVKREFPNLALTTENSDAFAGALNKTVANLEAHIGDFADADAIPLSGIDLRVLPIAAVVIGFGLIAAGVVARRRPTNRPVFAIGLIGLAMAAGPLIIALPHKSQAAERLLRSLSSSPENARRSREQFDTAKGTVDELRNGLLPAAASALGTTPDRLLAGLVADIPDLADLAKIDPALDNIEGDVRFRETARADLVGVKGIPITATAWGFIALGAGLALAGFSLSRRRSALSTQRR